mmetsp:Transcript_47156/g.142783  ORF Transcript_47156/g.142783 Transcript_47156/m.142783 type:complete len:520 (+) Transcript_47156:310-1869(+)
MKRRLRSRRHLWQSPMIATKPLPFICSQPSFGWRYCCIILGSRSLTSEVGQLIPQLISSPLPPHRGGGKESPPSHVPAGEGVFGPPIKGWLANSTAVPFLPLLLRRRPSCLGLFQPPGNLRPDIREARVCVQDRRPPLNRLGPSPLPRIRDVHVSSASGVRPSSVLRHVGPPSSAVWKYELPLIHDTERIPVQGRRLPGCGSFRESVIVLRTLAIRDDGGARIRTEALIVMLKEAIVNALLCVKQRDVIEVDSVTRSRHCPRRSGSRGGVEGGTFTCPGTIIPPRSSSVRTCSCSISVTPVLDVLPVEPQKVRKTHEAQKAQHHHGRHHRPTHGVPRHQLPPPPPCHTRRPPHPPLVQVGCRQWQCAQPQRGGQQGAEGEGQPPHGRPPCQAEEDLRGGQAEGRPIGVLWGELELMQAQLAPAPPLHLEPLLQAVLVREPDRARALARLEQRLALLGWSAAHAAFLLLLLLADVIFSLLRHHVSRSTNTGIFVVIDVTAVLVHRRLGGGVHRTARGVGC